MIAVGNISGTEFGQGGVFHRQIHAGHFREWAWQVNTTGPWSFHWSSLWLWGISCQIICSYGNERDVRNPAMCLCEQQTLLWVFSIRYLFWNEWLWASGILWLHPNVVQQLCLSGIWVNISRVSNQLAVHRKSSEKWAITSGSGREPSVKLQAWAIAPLAGWGSQCPHQRAPCIWVRTIQ